jgi:hypothetical protein
MGISPDRNGENTGQGLWYAFYRKTGPRRRRKGMNSFSKGIICFIVVLFPGVALISCKGDTAQKKEPSNRTTESSRVAEEQRKRFGESQQTIVAKVNGVPVMMPELLQEMNAIAPQYMKPGQKRDPKTDEKIRKEALNRLIWRELAVQAAKTQGMKAPAEAVAEELKRIKGEMKTEDAFRQNLAKSGITEEDLKKRIERNLLVEMVTEKEVFGKAVVAPDEARKVYEKKYAVRKGPSRPMTFEEAQPLIEKELMTAAVQKREDEWVAEMRKGAKIEIAP